MPTITDTPRFERVRCFNCDELISPAEVLPIGELALSAGDVMPAGRCPICEGFTYLDTLAERGRQRVASVIADVSSIEATAAKILLALSALTPMEHQLSAEELEAIRIEPGAAPEN